MFFSTGVSIDFSVYDNESIEIQFYRNSMCRIWQKAFYKLLKAWKSRECQYYKKFLEGLILYILDDIIGCRKK